MAPCPASNPSMDLSSSASAAQRPLTRGSGSATIGRRESVGPDSTRTHRGDVLSLRVLAKWLEHGE